MSHFFVVESNDREAPAHRGATIATIASQFWCGTIDGIRAGGSRATAAAERIAQADKADTKQLLEGGGYLQSQLKMAAVAGGSDELATTVWRGVAALLAARRPPVRAEQRRSICLPWLLEAARASLHSTAAAVLEAAGEPSAVWSSHLCANVSHIAARKGDAKMVALLRMNGASVTATDATGRSALQLLAEREFSQLQASGFASSP